MTLGSTEVSGPDGQGCPVLTWLGDTWSIVDGKAINTPTVGAGELLADPGLEATYTDGLCDSLSKQGSPTIAESADAHGGAKAQSFIGIAANNATFPKHTFVVGTWYLCSAWFKRSAGTQGWAYFGSNLAASSLYLSILGSSSYAQKLLTGRATSTSMDICCPIQANGGGGDTILVDDISIQALDLDTLFSSLSSVGTPNVIADVDLTIVAGTQSGLVLCLDSAVTPRNFLVAYHNRVNAFLDKAVWDGSKIVYTNLVSAAATYAANATLRVIKSGTSVSLSYNNAKIGATATVADATVISNTIHGLFSTYSGNTLDNFALWATGDENQYAILDTF